MQIAQNSTQTGWKQAYQDALFELDRGCLMAKLEAAQKAIDDRMHEVVSSGPPGRELMELEDAKITILLMKQHEQRI
jgi:hypothetical protein